MATNERKFSELTAKGTTIADTDLLAISESAGGGAYVSKSVTGANVKALVTDANLTTTDVTTNNVSTTKHGFAPKSPNDGTQFLDGLGNYDTVKDSDLSTSDITTNDVSTSKHGFTPKAPNNTNQYLRADATWAIPVIRVQTVTSSATVTATDSNDLVTITAQAEALTLEDPTGTPTEGQPLMFRIKDNGTARAITYGAQFRAIGVTLPTTTTISKTTYLGCVYNSTDTKWDVVGVNTEA